MLLAIASMVKPSSCCSRKAARCSSGSSSRQASRRRPAARQERDCSSVEGCAAAWAPSRPRLQKSTPAFQARRRPRRGRRTRLRGHSGAACPFGEVVRDGEGPGAPTRALRREAGPRLDDPFPSSPGTPRPPPAESRRPSRRRTKRNNALSWRTYNKVERGLVAAGIRKHQLVVGHGHGDVVFGRAVEGIREHKGDCHLELLRPTTLNGVRETCNWRTGPESGYNSRLGSLAQSVRAMES